MLHHTFSNHCQSVSTCLLRRTVQNPAGVPLLSWPPGEGQADNCPPPGHYWRPWIKCDNLDYSPTITVYLDTWMNISKTRNSCDLVPNICCLTENNSSDLERIQKSALKVILQEKFQGYKKGLAQLGLQTLEERRKQLCLDFAKKCVKSDKLKHMFPKNNK